MDILNDPARVQEVQKQERIRKQQESRFSAKFNECVGIYLLLLGSAIAVAALYGQWLTGQTNGWSVYVSGAAGWLCMYTLLHKYFPRWTWGGYGPLTPIKKAMLVTSCDTMLGYYMVKRLDWICTIFAGTKNPDGELPKRLLKECSNRIVILPLDVTSDESVTQATKIMEQHLIRRNHDLWGIFNNASVTVRGEVEWTPVDIFKQLAEVNIYGMVRITKACLPLIRKNQGRIVNMHDRHGRFTVPGCAAYGMTKYAAESFSDALRYEMHQWGVKVCALEINKNFNGIHDVIKGGDLWDSLDEKSMRHYGRTYYDNRTSSWERERESGDSDLREIVTAAFDGLLSRVPRQRYYIGGIGPMIKTYLYSTMPSGLLDKLIGKQYSSGTIPLALDR
ncbi:D-beta-hydroxybutyrate dehydrogenase, mitochondrial-like [Ptychodera flava]|uniref:D-beta-hydroxybutyrate dehydrogenase, mitochondrial-like n=1 Tax=Ptychodera flava TaxID=63121 RepID=UPI00396A6BE8